MFFRAQIVRLGALQRRLLRPDFPLMAKAHGAVFCQSFSTFKVKPGDLHVIIPKEKLDTNFARSSGPGGQGVNKVESKAEIRFHLGRAEWIEDDVKARFRDLYAGFINNDDEVYVSSQKYRHQDANLKDAIEKLGHMVRKSAIVPKVRKLRTNLSELTKSQRRDDKRHRSLIKENRRGPSWDD